MQNTLKEASYRNLYKINFCFESNSRWGLFYYFFRYEASFMNYRQYSCGSLTNVGFQVRTATNGLHNSVFGGE